MGSVTRGKILLNGTQAALCLVLTDLIYYRNNCKPFLCRNFYHFTQTTSPVNAGVFKSSQYQLIHTAKINKLHLKSAQQYN